MSNRTDIIKKVEAMTRGVGGVSALISMGDAPLPENIINLAVVAETPEQVAKVFRLVNFKVTEDFAPETSNTLHRDGNLAIKEYGLKDGTSVTLLVCAAGSLIPAPWWRPVFDNDGAASRAMGDSSKVAQDNIIGTSAAVLDLKPEPTPEPEFDPGFAGPEPEHKPEPPSVSKFEKRSAQDPSADDGWENIALLLRAAKRAIAGESYMWAAEVLADLRRIMIEKLCRQNGITENFTSSVQYLPEDARLKLERAYPVKLDKPSLITALTTAEEFLVSS
ncbi:MAG: hypothetical protein FWE86_02315 [Oscillospiraceae bacterium]|nr:hypothetical protein [Oscillospiraceae bacterium]